MSIGTFYVVMAALCAVVGGLIVLGRGVSAPTGRTARDDRTGCRRACPGHGLQQ